MTPFSKRELGQRLNILKKIAGKSGKKLEQKGKKIRALRVIDKKADGVASDADLASEEIIFKELGKAFPGEEVLGEEAFFNERKGKRDFTSYRNKSLLWVVDPLDGTNNYLNGFNYYSVCLSLLHKGKPIIGVVYRPSTGECFSAHSEKNAVKSQMSFSGTESKTRNIHLGKNTKTLNQGIMVTDLGRKQSLNIESEIYIYQKMLQKSRALRRLGSAALDMCYVAEGLFDGFWQRGLYPWDVAASGLICQQAGVKVTDYVGQNFCPFDSNILVARSPFYRKVQKEFRLK